MTIGSSPRPPSGESVSSVLHRRAGGVGWWCAGRPRSGSWPPCVFFSLCIMRRSNGPGSAARRRTLAVCRLLFIAAGWGVLGGWGMSWAAEVPEDSVGGLPAIRKDGNFVSADVCRECHAEEHASWHRTFHRTMTQVAARGNVMGAFDGTTVMSDGLAYRVGQDGGRYWAEMPDPDVMMYVVQGGKKLDGSKIPRAKRPVVMTTGSHHYQTYWVSSSRYGGLLQTLPLVYLKEDKRWIPREAAFMRGPGDVGRFVTQWNHHCIRCHSTGSVSAGGMTEPFWRAVASTRRCRHRHVSSRGKCPAFRVTRCTIAIRMTS